MSNKTTSNNRRSINVVRYCQLSDQLDKLSKLHFKLCEITKSFNSIFDIQLLLYIVVQLSGLIIRCFYQYIGMVNLLNSHENNKLIVWQNVITLVMSTLTWIELLWTTYACESLATEVNMCNDEIVRNSHFFFYGTVELKLYCHSCSYIVSLRRNNEFLVFNRFFYYTTKEFLE